MRFFEVVFFQQSLFYLGLGLEKPLQRHFTKYLKKEQKLSVK